MSSRARNKLTVKQVESLKKVGMYSDGGGLYLRIRESGRSWFFVGTLNGKRMTLGLGNAYDVTLAKARDKAREARLLLLDRKDPREVWRAPVEAQKSEVKTFGEYAREYVARIEGGFRNPKHRQQWRNTLTNHCVDIADLPIAELETKQIAECLEKIWIDKPETASRLRGRIEKVLAAAKADGLRSGDNPAKWGGVLEHALPHHGKRIVKHHAALPYSDIPTFMEELRKRDGVAAKALEFLILTAGRSGEVRGMTWGEVDMIGKLWTVPADRMKASEMHEVPLCDAAISVLNEVTERGLGKNDVVFPAPRGGSLSDMTLSAVLKRMDVKVTVHGFRSTFRDWAGDTTEFTREVVEMALAHTVGSATERAYRRGRALEKRRELMGAWATYCIGD